jgi:hypothetical protein
MPTNDIEILKHGDTKIFCPECGADDDDIYEWVGGTPYLHEAFMEMFSFSTWKAPRTFTCRECGCEWRETR